MQLILNKELISRKESKVKNTITIISTRKWLIEEISEKIRLTDFDNIKKIEQDIFNAVTINLSGQTVGVIIDIGNNCDVEDTVNLIKNNTPRDCWCVLVGDIDSISIAQQFTDHGLLYLNMQSQSAELTQHLLKGIQVESGRRAFFISVLGCKGGIGTTLLSYHLAHEMTQIKKSPTLLLQGNQGSQDLDLITEKKMSTELTEYKKNFDLMLCKDKKLSDADIQRNKKHNFIIFDQSIHNATKENLADYIEHSNCIVLMLDNSMVSVRVAKEFIDFYTRFKRDNKQSVKLIICLNESRPITKDMLDTSDIQSLLGKNIDIKTPYIYKKNNSLSDQEYFGRRKKTITELASQTLGIRMDSSTYSGILISKIITSLKNKR
ncbi:pilus assembly protein CpaE [Yersinia mollaretii]|uniref:Tight adherance operon protein n=1 Tax=Yersinia mollaretii TaxID=33060 RepID=A0AA36LUU6_YERMO|nr:pilus assembly protein CpaE [Yersinia mollaretii]MDA5535652.1 pilus assembly protein CpaE [Yersinia mollaretii]CNI67137.1 putative tight adherance operon protein [Yersinia mollaretii]